MKKKQELEMKLKNNKLSEMGTNEKLVERKRQKKKKKNGRRRRRRRKESQNQKNKNLLHGGINLPKMIFFFCHTRFLFNFLPILGR